MYTYVYIQIKICIYKCIFIHKCRRMYTYMYENKNKYSIYIPTCIYICIQIYINIYISIVWVTLQYIYIYMYVCIYYKVFSYVYSNATKKYVALLLTIYAEP